LHAGDLFELLNHFLMVFDHLFGKLLHLGVVRLLLCKLAQLDFILIVLE